MADANSTPEQDDNSLGMFPSAVNPLTALGIDPDMARANPELLTALNPTGIGGGQPPATAQPPVTAQPTRGPIPAPNLEPEPAQTGASAKQAGATGGAAPTPPTPTTAADYGMAGLQSLNQNAKMATDAANAIPTTDPEIARLTAERQKYAAPAPLYDPKTGKMLSQTTEIDPKTGQPVTLDPKPTTGTRIWRGVRGGLQGLLTSGIRGGLLGAINPALEGSEAYGAPDKAYQNAEQQREQKLAGTDTDLGNTFKDWKNQVDASKAKASELRANAGLGKDLTTGATGMENAATGAQREKDTATNNAANTPEAKDAAALKLNQGQFDQRKTRVATDPAFQSMSPLNKTLYMLNGKIPDPREPNEAEVNAAQAARALVVFKAQHGGQGPQTLEDFNSIQAAARGQMDKGKGKGDANSDDEVSSIVADATGKKQALADNYERLKDGSYMRKDGAGGVLSAQQFQNKLDAFRTDANVKLAKKGAQMDDHGSVVHKDSADTRHAKTAPPPSTHVFNAEAWQAANPKGDVNAAKALAQKRGYQVD